MFNRWVLAVHAILVLGLGVSATAAALEPADPDLIPEGRQVLDYLMSIQGKKIVSGMQRTGGGQGPFPAVLHATGREAAIRDEDMGGFHPEGSDVYNQVQRGVVARSLYWSKKKGGIMAMAFHMGNPMHPKGSAWKNRPEGSTPPDIGRMVTPGTEEYKAFRDQLSHAADYLEELADAGVPLLWWPLMEIDGGWFWWSDAKNPENSAALYRLEFDYLVKERGIHNLIWVWETAHVTHGVPNAYEKGASSLEEVAEFRKRFYPGDEYVDIVGNAGFGNPRGFWGGSMEEDYEGAYKMLQLIAPGKPAALTQGHGVLNVAKAKKNGVPWLYHMVWSSLVMPREWTFFAFNHEHMITLDELPLLAEGNVMPNVRIEWPTDGLVIESDELDLAGFASDRNGNLKTVEAYALEGPWRTWVEREPEQVFAEVEGRGTRLGEARMGAANRWTFTWKGIPAGQHEIIALARDSEGAVGWSNVVRIAAGIENLALGKKATASSKSPWGGPAESAVDGDLWTQWWADHREEDTQWLQVDLGSLQTVGAVSVLWWKAYAKDYTVQVSEDGETWWEVARVENRTTHHGDSTVHRFEPVKARYVRLHFTRPAYDWQHYCIYEFGVYDKLPD